MGLTLRAGCEVAVAQRISRQYPLHDITERVLVVAVIDAKLLLLEIGV